MSNEDYTPPESTATSKQTDQALAQAAKATAADTSEKKAQAPSAGAAKEPSLNETPDVIGIGKMINAKGDLVTDVMKARIERHLKYLRSETSFKDREEATNEQVTFMETVGNMLKLDFEQYVVVTDFFLGEIRKTPEVFSESVAFRFIAGLTRQYPSEYIKNYQTYIELLSKIAKNWKVRYKLGQLMDITYAISDFDRRGKENVTQYFRKVTSV